MTKKLYYRKHLKLPPCHDLQKEHPCRLQPLHGSHHRCRCRRKWWPAPLWDKHALVPNAPFLWGLPRPAVQHCQRLDHGGLWWGNGPLTSEQRQEINTAGSVLRINAMNNRQASSTGSRPQGSATQRLRSP